MTDLSGKVVAMICRGSDADRAIAVALAGAGADVALGTVARAQVEEFSTASIANELWAIGREQFNTLLNASDPAEAASFAEEVCARLGRCDAVIVAPGLAGPVEFDELSRDEWEPLVSGTLTASVMSAQAFSRVLERGGGGTVVFVLEVPEAADIAGAVVVEGLRSLSAGLAKLWRDRGVRTLAVERAASPAAVVEALA